MRLLRQYSWLVCLACVVVIVLFVTLVPQPTRGLYLLHRTRTAHKMEGECRRLFEAIFRDAFPSCRPAFLHNPRTGHNLELDGWNPRLKIAFEYNGAQHYFYNPFFHADVRAFEQMQARDAFKRAVCAREGITLITIPYTVRLHELEDYIRSRLATSASSSVRQAVTADGSATK